jgi:hypothetical protein
VAFHQLLFARALDQNHRRGSGRGSGAV